jgi:hypothetical protein
MEITKEYFDERMSALTTDVKAATAGLAAVKEAMATKDDLRAAEERANENLAAMETRLKAHAEGLQADLAGMIERTVNVSDRVAKLEGDVAAIKHALHI